MEITKKERQYDIDALKALQDKRRANIKIFEEAILTERRMMERELQIITVLELEQQKEK